MAKKFDKAVDAILDDHARLEQALWDKRRVIAKRNNQLDAIEQHVKDLLDYATFANPEIQGFVERLEIMKSIIDRGKDK